MDRPELALARLSNQYLLRAGERMEVLRAMNGLQAQFLSNALHAMRLRSTAYDAAHAADGLVKGWTLRGTMHIFAEADLPLFLHSGCRYRSRDWTVPSFWNQRPDWALTPQRQTYFSDLIVDVLTQGPLTREALKDRCRAAGMTQAEEDSMFHPWGGGRLGWAAISDYIGRPTVFTIFFALQIVAFTMLPNITHVLVFQALILVVVSCYGGGFSNLPAFVGDLFGTKQLGAIHGYLLTTWSMGGIIGPAIVSQVRERTGSYEPVFYIFIVLVSIAFLISLLIRWDIKRIEGHPKAEKKQKSASKGLNLQEGNN